MNTNKWILLVVAGGFAMMTVELRFLHRAVYHEEAVAYVAPISAALGFVSCLLALAASRVAKVLGMAMLAAVVLAGIVGTYYHTGFQPQAFIEVVTMQGAQRGGDGASEEGEERRSEESAPPAFGPMALCGLAAVGLLAAWGRPLAGTADVPPA